MKKRVNVWGREGVGGREEMKQQTEMARRAVGNVAELFVSWLVIYQVAYLLDRMHPHCNFSFEIIKFTLPYLTLPYLTLPYLTLPYLTLP